MATQDQSSQSRQLVDIPLREIRQNPSQRPIPNEDVAALANAMAIDALGFPVSVRIIPGIGSSRYEIVAGGDRLEAAKRLGWETILAEIITGEDASSSGASEGPLLHAEGQTRHAAVRPQVRWRDAGGTVRRKPHQKLALVDQSMVAEKTIVLDQASGNPHIRELSFGEFEIGVPPIPLESADVESLRESIFLVGQTTPVLVREFPDGRLALVRTLPGARKRE